MTLVNIEKTAENVEPSCRKETMYCNGDFCFISEWKAPLSFVFR